MMKFYSYLTTTLFLFLGFISFGQELTDSTTTNDSTIVIKTPKHKIQVSTIVNYGSTNMNNEFVEKLLFGGRIENELKDKAIEKIDKKGRFGVEVNYNIKYINLDDTLFHKLPNYHYYIGFGSYNNISASYSKDLFSLIFYGNKQHIRTHCLQLLRFIRNCRRAENTS